jgi:hypothetical protein
VGPVITFSWITNNLCSMNQSENILKYNSNPKSHKSSWEKLVKINWKNLDKMFRFYWTGASMELFSSQFAIKKTWHRNRVSVFQFCRSVMKKWRFSRYFSDTRIWREKRSSENESSLSHRNILKWENLFRSLSGFSRKKNAIRVFSIRSQNSYRFLSRSFRSLNWTLGSQVENF